MKSAYHPRGAEEVEKLALVAKDAVWRTVYEVRKIFVVASLVLVFAGCSQSPGKDASLPEKDELTGSSVVPTADGSQTGTSLATTTTVGGFKAPMPTVSQEGFVNKMRVALIIESALRELTLEAEEQKNVHLGGYTYGMSAMLYSGFDPRDSSNLAEAITRVGGLGNMSMKVYTVEGATYEVIKDGVVSLAGLKGKIDALEITDGTTTACHWVTADSGTSGVGLRGPCKEESKD